MTAKWERNILLLEISLHDLICILTENPEETLESGTKMDIARAIADQLSFEELKSQILTFYMGETIKDVSAFEKQHNQAYSLFTQIWGEALWR